MEKSPDAFRTISEVSTILDTPAHVLRFWESRFPQVKPVKRAGGRRYYRPSDLALLTGIKQLLHDDGMTIRGVQKLLRERGVRHVASLGESAQVAAPEAAAANAAPTDTAPAPQQVAEAENPKTATSSTTSTDQSEPSRAPFSPLPAKGPSVVVPLTPGMTIPGLPLPVAAQAGAESAPSSSLSQDVPATPRPRKPQPDAPEAPMLFDAPLLPHQSRVTPMTPPQRALAEDGQKAPPQWPQTSTPSESAGPQSSVLRPGLADPPKLQTPVDTLDIDDDGLPPDPWLPSLLRSVPQARFAPHSEALGTLHARLTALRTKTHAAAHPSHR